MTPNAPTTNGDAIAALEESKAKLQEQCAGADKDTLNQLMTANHNISSEIGAKVLEALNNAPYIPATDAFKSVTADAQDFLDTLNKLKTVFGAIGTVASAIDTVVKLITTHAL